MNILRIDGKLPKEIESGNTEYKRRLDHITKNTDKFKKLASQLIWRIEENTSVGLIPEAIYYLGLDDDGTIAGINIDIINKSINVLSDIADSTLRNIYVYNTDIHEFDDGCVAKIILRIKPILKNNMRVGFLGKSGSGKTTLISMLCYDIEDNGNGSGRTSILRYDHELENGLTSSIKQDIIGFKDNKLINYNNIMGSWSDVVNNSDRIIELIDLPGNDKYSKTMIYGLCSIKPDLVFILIPFDTDSKSYDKSDNIYIDLCENLQIKYKIIYSKCDLIPKTLNNNSNNSNDIYISSKNKYGIEKLLNYLNLSKSHEVFNEKVFNEGFNEGFNEKVLNNCLGIEFVINETLNIPNVGIVVIGILRNGIIRINDKLLIGPYRNRFIKISVSSIHKRQVSSDLLNTGESGSLVLQIYPNIKVDKHMVIINDSYEIINKSFHNYFYVKFDNGSYSDFDFNNLNNIQLMVNIGNIYSRVLFLNIKNNTLFKGIFSDNNPRYIGENNKVVIRHNSRYIIGNLYNL